MRNRARLWHGAPMRTDFLTTADAAALLQVSVATVNRWAASGRLPEAMRLPGEKGARLYHRADVERLARNRAA